MPELECLMAVAFIVSLYAIYATTSSTYVVENFSIHFFVFRLELFYGPCFYIQMPF